MNIFESDYANVVFEEELELVIVTWKNRALTLEEYSRPFMAAFEFQRTTHVENYISDIREQKIVSPVLRHWFQTEAVPTAVRQGLKHAAVIFEGNVFKKYYLNNILNTTKMFGLPMKFFYTLEEAKDWFRSFQK
jgi:hypothetical protein